MASKIIRSLSYTLIQTYSLKAGIKFGESERKAALDEMKQIQNRLMFHPIKVNNMSETEREHAMESLMFLVQKRCGRIKAKTCENGSTQRKYITKMKLPGQLWAIRQHILQYDRIKTTTWYYDSGHPKCICPNRNWSVWIKGYHEDKMRFSGNSNRNHSQDKQWKLLNKGAKKFCMFICWKHSTGWWCHHYCITRSIIWTLKVLDLKSIHMTCVLQ